jgi:hypothetical protein
MCKKPLFCCLPAKLTANKPFWPFTKAILVYIKEFLFETNLSCGFCQKAENYQ